MRSVCRRCGVPRPRVSGSDLDDAAGCVHCRDLKLQFEGVVCLWSYQDKVCEAIVAAKYVHHAALGDALGRRLGHRVEEALSDDPPDIVTIVPSHRWRQFQRGGNGNQAIGTAVAKTIDGRFEMLLRATRPIEKQAWLDDKARLKNVRDAFSMKKSYAFPKSPKVANQHILVVDDVLTTGATANEVARVLLAAGARRVSLAIVARAIRS